MTNLFIGVIVNLSPCVPCVSHACRTRITIYTNMEVIVQKCFELVFGVNAFCARWNLQMVIPHLICDIGVIDICSLFEKAFCTMVTKGSSQQNILVLLVKETLLASTRTL